MTHKSIPAETRRAAGVVDSLIRLSVGIEEVEDLIDDLEKTFKQLNRHSSVQEHNKTKVEENSFC